MKTKQSLTWFAVIYGNTGGALDACPEELAGYRRELGSRIVGEYETEEAALEAVTKHMVAQVKERKGVDHDSRR